jgi:ferric-dicitrate binding protein FerR (iron transport regulator)
MKIATVRFLAFTLPWWGIAISVHAQAPAVVTVSQVLPFASSGSVSSLTKEEAAMTAALTSGTPVVTTTAGTATLTVEGGKIITGADGASSLLLGSAGTARMGADSEIKVPTKEEKSHSLELLKGELFMNISGEELKKRAAGEFRLKTPTALLAVKGTKFFAVSKDDTDTIGVHEGSVTVTEPTSGKRVTLESGNAVTVGTGIISEVRAMTDEEKGDAVVYAAADLVRTPLPLVVKRVVPNTKQLQILMFSHGQLSVLGVEPVDRLTQATKLESKIGTYFGWRASYAGLTPMVPTMTANGLVGYDWKTVSNGGSYLCQFDLRNAGAFSGREIGILFRLSAADVKMLRIRDEAGNNQRIQLPESNDGDFMECLLQPLKMSGGSTKSPVINFGSMLQFSTIQRVKPPKEDKGSKDTIGRQNNAGFKVFLSDFELLSLPK